MLACDAWAAQVGRSGRSRHRGRFAGYRAAVPETPDSPARPGAAAPPRPAPRLRERARPWVVAAAVVAVVLAMIAVAGGFRSADADLGRPLPAGQEVALGGWRVVVVSAEYTDQSLSGYETDPEVRVQLRLTWTGEATRLEPIFGVIQLVTDGDVRSEASLRQPPSRSSGYDPDVPQTSYLTWSTPHPPGRVAVLLQTEQVGQSYLFEDSWGAGRVVGHVAVPCPDRRKG